MASSPMDNNYQRKSLLVMIHWTTYYQIFVIGSPTIYIHKWVQSYQACLGHRTRFKFNYVYKWGQPYQACLWHRTRFKFEILILHKLIVLSTWIISFHLPFLMLKIKIHSFYNIICKYNNTDGVSSNHSTNYPAPPTETKGDRKPCRI